MPHHHPLAPRRHVRLAAVLTTTATILLATGCAPSGAGAAAGSTSEAAAGTRTVSTAYGDVEVPEAPARVAGVSYDTTWQLMSLDVVPVAVQDYGPWISDFTTEQQAFVDGVPTVGTFGELNVEAVAAARPELIIGDVGEVDEATYARLSEIAPTVVVGGEDRGDWQAITEQTAEAVGATDVWEEDRAAYEAERDRIRSRYADVIAGNRWIHFSLGDDPSQFSVQEPSGATGSLVVDELGMLYGPGVPADASDSGYSSYPLEQLGTVFEGVTVALSFANADGSPNPGVRAVEDSPLFQRLEVARAGHVFHLTSSVTDYVTATAWLLEVEEEVLSVL